MTTFDVSARSLHPSAPGGRSTRSGAPGAGVLRTVAAGILAAGLLLAPVSASAHVRVQGDSTAAGSFSALTFRVPNESDTASTVTVQVQLPQDTPFLYVSTKPVDGWEAVITEATLPTPVDASGTTITKAARTVTWTAEDDTAIKPGEYQEFAISVGPLPAAGTVMLPATQTYSDGKVVKWDQPETPGGEEPESPAPALVVTAAAETATPAPTVAPSTVPAAVAPAGADGVARGLAGGALVVAVGALVAAVTGRRRARVGA